MTHILSPNTHTTSTEIKTLHNDSQNHHKYTKVPHKIDTKPAQSRHETTAALLLILQVTDLLKEQIKTNETSRTMEMSSLVEIWWNKLSHVFCQISRKCWFDSQECHWPSEALKLNLILNVWRRANSSFLNLKSFPRQSQSTAMYSTTPVAQKVQFRHQEFWVFLIQAGCFFWGN